MAPILERAEAQYAGTAHEEPARFRSELAVSEPEPGDNIRDETIDMKTYGIRLADTDEGRNSASVLIQKMYAWRGYLTASRVEAHPNRITLAASHQNGIYGTVTLGIDSELGILADEVFKDQIDPLRQQGAKVCEITKLAVDTGVRSQMALAALFHTLFIYGYHIHRCTHAFIEVNPRHRRYYEHMLGFQRMSSVRENPRVKAPACLLSIRLDDMAEHIRRHGGTSDHPQAGRSLYPYFFSAREEEGIINRLKTS
ncbi:N-acyl amino acid synthase FeeM domain-containing protein [Pseudoduganella sp. OTU4001]|uniref:N-acyl amino acid synthase FeeM domain-containing protein n=1 Tax=Pseudoduganella sp. OTU4001 TaxID=3043854 RepID=UPI00313BB1C2